MAQAYPEITVHGFDLDRARLAAAHRHATEFGVADRVKFSALDAARPDRPARMT